MKNSNVTRKQKMPFVRLPGGLDPTVFEIEENMLPYGMIRIELSVRYESSYEDLEKITAKDTTWLDVQASALKAVMQG